MAASPAFPETVWDDVLEAARRDAPASAREAVVRLCERYHGPIRAWFQAQPPTRDAAEDLAQEFLTRWLTREAPLGDFQRGERRFREFLATCLRRFGVSEFARRTAVKRGGGASHVPLEDEEPSVNGNAGEVLDLELARSLQAEVEEELAGRWEARMPGDGWRRLREIALGREAAVNYASLARELGMPVGTIKGWVFRIRREYYEAFVRRVRFLAGPGEVAGEIRHLYGLLARYGPSRAPTSAPQ